MATQVITVKATNVTQLQSTSAWDPASIAEGRSRIEPKAVIDWYEITQGSPYLDIKQGDQYQFRLVVDHNQAAQSCLLIERASIRIGAVELVPGAQVPGRQYEGFLELRRAVDGTDCRCRSVPFSRLHRAVRYWGLSI